MPDKSPREWTEDELADWLTSPAGPEPSPYDSAEGEALMDEIAKRLRVLSIAHEIIRASVGLEGD